MTLHRIEWATPKLNETHIERRMESEDGMAHSCLKCLIYRANTVKSNNSLSNSLCLSFMALFWQVNSQRFKSL